MAYSGAVSLGTATLAGSYISFSNTLDTSGVLSVTTNGTYVDWYGTIQNNGRQSYGGAVTLGAAATFVSNQYIEFNGALTTSAGATLAVTTNGTYSYTWDNVTYTYKSGYQAYNGAVTLGAAATLISNQTVSFGSTLATSSALTVTADGYQEYDGAVALGAAATFTGSYLNFNDTLTTTANGTLRVTTSGTNVDVNGQTNKSGYQSYTGAVTLGAAATLVSNESVRFSSTLETSSAITITADGYLEYAGAVTLGGAATFSGRHISFRSTLSTTGGAVSVTTTQYQNYAGAVTLNSAATLSSSYVSFEDTLTTTANGTLAITTNGTYFDEQDRPQNNGAQTFSGAVTLGAAATLISNQAVRFYSTLTTGTGATLAVTTNGTYTYVDWWTGATHTYNSGQQSYDGTVTLGAAATFVSNQMISFGAEVTTNASGTLTVTTGAHQSYQGAVTLGAAATLSSSYIGFGSTLATTAGA